MSPRQTPGTSNSSQNWWLDCYTWVGSVTINFATSIFVGSIYQSNQPQSDKGGAHDPASAKIENKGRWADVAVQWALPGIRDLFMMILGGSPNLGFPGLISSEPCAKERIVLLPENVIKCMTGLWHLVSPKYRLYNLPSVWLSLAGCKTPSITVNLKSTKHLFIIGLSSLVWLKELIII